MARCGDDTATKSALQDALECMQLMDADSNLRGTKGTPSFWSPRALLKTMLDCTMAIARIEMVVDKPAAAIRYKSGLCQFLGIELKVLEKIGHLCDINMLNKQAVQVVESIPRKFAKDEDVDQAICAMKEVAGALVVCAGGRASSSFAWQGLATYFIAHAFARSKSQYDTAYAVIQSIADVLRHLGLVHLAHDCAGLIICFHIEQPDSKVHVAAAVTESILSSDILRARALIDAFNLQTKEPWSVYVGEFIERAIDADAHWMHTDALCEWHKVKDSADTPDKNVSVLIDEMLRQSLEPYT
ncbi:hypothetical protein LPJ73_008527 [Coemansia sp. RSA 2703]|nr:hypothetical protein LPJ73_008527 [Coemansia sp. RSA 2703]